MIKAFKAAWRHTLPILAGYVFLGITFGLLMKTAGYPVWVPILMSLLIYSGALEFAAIPLLSQSFDPIGSFVMALMISARHLFYGIPMLKKYEDSGKLKPFLIFALTDETFSVSSSIDPPQGVSKKAFYTAISFLDYSYWVLGTALGAICGNFISFDTSGIDFALTALFIVLLLEQMRSKEGILSGCIGLASAAFVLFVFGASNLVILSMGVILAALLLAKRGILHEKR